jgi:hypothetical protein
VVDYAGGVRYRDHFYLFSGHCLSEEAVDGAPFDVGRAWLFGYAGLRRGRSTALGPTSPSQWTPMRSTRLARTASSRGSQRSAMISAGAS